MLNFLGKKEKEIIIVGIFFTISVFLTYLLLGIGILKIFQTLAIFSILSKFIHCSAIILAFMLGFYSLYDYIVYLKTGKTKDMKLQLPNSIKKKIHSIIRTEMRTKHLVLASLITGFLVSLLESVCTGQVYLPTIVFTAREPHLKVYAYFYLVLYNLMFILPLIGIFLLAYAGITSTTIGRFEQKHFGLIKILLCLLFFSLGILLLVV